MAVSKSIGSIDSMVCDVFQNREGLRDLLQILVQEAMACEVERHVNASRHERSPGRRGHRNGYKPRTFKTRVGQLALSVPQVRGGEPYSPSMFGKWERSERALLVACADMYFQGVSTRRVANVLQTMCGGEISSSTVSRVAMELDEKLAEFRDRRLNDEYPYLIVDARYEKVRVDGKVISQAVMVVAGITHAGSREILDWRLGDSESEATWGEMFRTLKDRGLKNVKLIISDAHSGIRAAMKRHFQGVCWQRCRVHFKREIARKVSHTVAKDLMKELVVVFKGDGIAEQKRRGEEMACRWEKRYEKVAAMLRDGLEDCLAVEHFPLHHRRKLASTNLLENLMRQLKRRTAVVCVFPNRASCDRLIGSQLLEVHETWISQEKMYLSMEGGDIR